MSGPAPDPSRGGAGPAATPPTESPAKGVGGGLTRRDLLRIACVGGAAAALPSVASASYGEPVEHPVPRPDMVGLLYDATICTGCKACMSACNTANDLPPDTAATGGLWMAPRDLNSKTKNIIKVAKEEGTGRWSYIKRQCMHCLEPACISGCPFKALDKDRWGVVTWTGSRCIGCRYCEIACPFEVPKFEWDRFNPRIVKCELCFHRLSKGLRPGCTEGCPTGAVIYGLRSDLLAEAKRRVRENPGKYDGDRVYGETDGGGTQVLYLTRLPHRVVGLPGLGTSSVPYYATKVNAVLYKWLSGPVLAFGVLAAVIRRNVRKHEEHRAHAPDGHLPEQL